MNNIRHPNLEYHKTCVLNYNNVEYFLYHWPLISCIKNILEISDLFQNFALNSEVLYKDIEIILFLKFFTRLCSFSKNFTVFQSFSNVFAVFLKVFSIF